MIDIQLDRYQLCGQEAVDTYRASIKGCLAALAIPRDTTPEVLNYHMERDESQAFFLKEDGFGNLPDKFKDWISSFRSTLGSIGVIAFNEAQTRCPVSLDTLCGTGIESMMLLPKLRHNIMFDPEQHFIMSPVPFYGPRAPIRSQKYWQAVHYEFELYVFMLNDAHRLRLREPQHWNTAFSLCRQRIPALIDSLRDIMMDLTRESAKQLVADALNSERWMEEIQGGGLDFKRLSRWWGEALITQCAQNRDSWVRQLEERMYSIPAPADANAVVAILKELLTLFEVMELDRANHIIRGNRKLMLATAVPYFQQHYFYSMRIGVFDASSGVAWFNRDPLPPLPQVWSEDSNVGYLGASRISHFLNRSVKTLLDCVAGNPVTSCFPSTFSFDFERLNSTCKEVQWSVFQEICTERLAIVFQTVGRAHEFNGAIIAQFLARLRDITGFTPDHNLADHIGLEMARVALATHLSLEDVTRSESGSGSRSHIPMMRLSEGIIDQLHRDLNPFGAVFQQHLRKIERRLIDSLEIEVSKWLNPSFKDVCEALVCRVVLEKDAPYCYRWQFYPITTQPAQRIPGVIDLRKTTRRLTMLLVFHWRIWGPQLYARGESGVDDWINGLGWDPESAQADFLENFEEFPSLRRYYYPSPEERAMDAAAASAPREVQSANAGAEEGGMEYPPQRERTGDVPRSERMEARDGEQDDELEILRASGAR